MKNISARTQKPIRQIQFRKQKFASQPPLGPEPSRERAEHKKGVVADKCENKNKKEKKKNKITRARASHRVFTDAQMNNEN